MKNNLMQRKTIHVDKINNIPVATFKQEDDATLKLALFSNSLILDCTGQTLKLGATRKDGILIELIDGYTINKNEIDFVLKNSVIAIPGIIECDLEIKDSSGKLTTASFYIVSNKKVLSGDSISGTNEISALEKVNQWLEDSKDLLDYVNENMTEIEGVKLLKGEKGDTGEQGIQGVQGIQGIQGEKGEPGLGATQLEVTKQDKVDNTLVTKEKSIPKAINEVVASLDNKANLTLKEIKLKSNLKIGDIIITNGYNVVGDGGHGKYIVVESNGLDNGYFVRVNDNITLKLLHNGVVYLEQFGGISDNITDNAIPFINALTGSSNITVNLMSGTYRTSPLNFNNLVNGNKLIGIKPSFELSNGGTKIAPISTQNHLINFSGTITSQVKGFVFKNIEITDKENYIQDTIIKCLYCTGFTMDIYCFKSTKTILSLKSCWEFNIEDIFIRNYNSITTQCILFDDINTNTQGIDENISTIYFKNVDLEGVNSPFIKSKSNSKASNIMIGTISFETNLTNLFTEDGLIDSFDKLKTNKPLALFDFEFMNGLTIESINLTGFSKKSYKDANNNYWTNSLFKLNGFYVISVGNILIGDSSSFIYFGSGDGHLNGVLNIESLVSSIQNRTYTNATNNLVMYNNIIDGQITINRNSFEVNNVLPLLKENIRYEKETLYKLLSNGFRGHFKMTNDSTSENKIVFTRIDTSYQTILNANVTTSLNIKIKFKTSTPTGTISVKSLDGDGTVVNTNVYSIVNTTNYQELNIPFIRSTGVSNIKIEFPVTMNDVCIDYISTTPYIKQFESGKNASSTVAQEVKTITFNTKFNSIPNVVVSLVGGTPSLTHTILVNNITQIGFDVYCSRASATFCYIAMEN